MSKYSFVRVLLLVSLCTLVLTSWASCTGKKGDDGADSEQTGGKTLSKTLAKIQARGALKVGLSSFNPWAMQDTRGNWIGFEVDVAKKLAESLGVPLELVPTAWAGIIPALLTGKFDMIIGGMSITPERAAQVTFSTPYEYSKTVLLLNRSVTVAAAEELNVLAYRFVGRAGSSPAALTNKLFPEAQFKSFDDDGLSVQDLINGQADGFLTTSIEGAIYSEEYTDFVYIPDWGREMEKEDIAFALPKNIEQAWLEHLNQWIQENWDNGFLEQNAQYWFESRDWTRDYQLD